MVALSFALLLAGSGLSVNRLECEAIPNPLNVDVARPKLSWVVSSSEEGQSETGYQIQVASSPTILAKDRGDLWDTGRCASNLTLGIPYDGRPLASIQSVYWKVRVWDAHGIRSAWSPMGRWTMGLLQPADWKARWIAAPDAPRPHSATLLFRSRFVVEKPVHRALCFVCGLGQYEMWIGGKRVGDDWITPGWTEYAKTCLADCYDVTPLIWQGRNAIAMHIGNGMYDMSGDTRSGQQTNKVGPKKLICQIVIEYRDGTHQTVCSDGTWRWNWSPETYSGVFGGEDWDARSELPGWRSNGFDDRSWPAARVVRGPGGVLRGVTHAAPPMKLISVRKPVSISKPTANLWVVDLGQNAAYVPEISVHGASGSRVVLRPAEILKPDGAVDQATMRPGKIASYILRGGGAETWHPSFWYVGSRYWQIEASDAMGRAIDPEDLSLTFQGLMVHADVKRSGTFRCSNDLFNRIHDLIWWAMCANFASVISDCPHREKSGWLEQDHLMGPSLMYSFDMRTMFRKVIDDIHDTQQPNGLVPTMAPEFFFYSDGFRDSVEWGASSLILPEMVRDWYADRSVVPDNYEGMRRYADYLGTQAHDGILSNGLGDWTGSGGDPRTPPGITDTAYYYRVLGTLASFARSLGRTADAQEYGRLAAEVKRRFDQSFVNAGDGKVGTGSQSAQATALDLGLIEPRDEPAVFRSLLNDIEAQHEAVSCGEVGFPSLLHVLDRFGQDDLIAKMNLQSDRPGYGYQLKKGRTTLTETWDAAPNSQDHFALGHLMEWFYADLVGIQRDPLGVAFSRIIVHPHPVAGVEWAQATYDSVRGPISCSWRLNAGRFHAEVTIPANTTATVWVPCRSGTAVRVGYPLGKGLGVVAPTNGQNGFYPIAMQSGRFSFDSVVD